MTTLRGNRDRQKSISSFGDNVTVQSIGSSRIGLDLTPPLYGVAEDAAEASSTTTVINATSHAALAGDMIFLPSSDEWAHVVSVSANAITVAPALAAAPSATDPFHIYRRRDLKAKKLHRGTQLQNGTALSGDFQTAAINAWEHDEVVFTIETSSVTTGSGTFTVQYRINDDSGNTSGWIDMTTLTLSHSGSDVSNFFHLQSTPPGQLRVKWVGSASDGTVDIWWAGKGIGSHA